MILVEIILSVTFDIIKYYSIFDQYGCTYELTVIFIVLHIKLMEILFTRSGGNLNRF